jgi:hypothetical protein
MTAQEYAQIERAFRQAIFPGKQKKVAKPKIKAPRPTLDTAEDRLSQYVKGVRVIWNALKDHYDSTGKGMKASEIIKILDTAPRKGGHAVFIRPATIRTYLCVHGGELWTRRNAKGRDVTGTGENGLYFPL